MTRRLTWHTAGESDDQLREYLLLALLRSRVCVTLQNSGFDYLYIANLPKIWSVGGNRPPNDLGMFGDALGQQLLELKNAVLADGQSRNVSAELEDDQIFEFHIEAVQSVQDRKQLLTTIVDLTETSRRERVLKVLLREVSHRSKNLLAIIQSIASQTARHATTLDQFLGKFRGRLFSLSQSQDLITDANWRGAYLHELIESQIGKYRHNNRPVISITGDDVLLTPNAALHIGLAVHELIVNAITAGAALDPGHLVSIESKKIDIEGVPSVELVWHEPADGRGNLAPSGDEGHEKRFGSIVLERVVPSSVSGHAEYVVAADGVHYRLTFPRGQDGQSNDPLSHPRDRSLNGAFATQVRRLR